MHAIFHDGATLDLTAAGDWYESKRTGLGAELQDEVDHAIETILETPRTWAYWPGAEHVEVRRFVLAQFPFALAFVVREERVIVLAVAHAKRRPFYWRDRVGETR